MKPSAGRRARSNTNADFSVFFGCHGQVLSMPTQRIERLVLSDEVQVCHSTSAAGAVPVVRCGSSTYAAWNLGKMLAVGPLNEAWVLLRVSHGGAELPLALGVGPCLRVSAIPEVSPIPPGVFKERHGALWGTFPTEAIGRLGPVLMGLCLDPLRLWTQAELDQSAAALIAGSAK